MIVTAPVAGDGTIDPRWGRANRLVIVEVVGGDIVSWREVEVSWNDLHDQGAEGAHHARVVRFLREQAVEVVVAAHMGTPMLHMLAKLGLRVHLEAAGDARAAILAAVR